MHAVAYMAVCCVWVAVPLCAWAEAPDVSGTVEIGGIFDGNWDAGAASAHATEIAVDDFNAYLEQLGASWSLSITVVDAQSQNDLALEYVREFDQNGIDMLVGMGFSSHISAANPYLMQNGMIVVSHASTSTTLATDDYTFRLVPNDSSQAPTVANMLEDAGIDVLVMVVRDDVWGMSLATDVAASFEGSIIPGFVYPYDTSGFATELSSLDSTIHDLVREYGSERVGVLQLGIDRFPHIIQAMEPYENLTQVRWFSVSHQAAMDYFLEDPHGIAFAEATGFTVTHPVLSAGNHIRDMLDAKYHDMYNSTLDMFGYAAYDSVWLLGTTILHTQNTDTNILAAAIPHVASHMLGATGNLGLDEYGDLATAHFEVWQVVDGAWADVSPLPGGE